jgi:hypothetical protein
MVRRSEFKPKKMTLEKVLQLLESLLLNLLPEFKGFRERDAKKGILG